MISNNGKSIRLKRAFSVKVETLFSAWSRPEIFKTWWKDLAVAEMDFRTGGSYKLSWISHPTEFTTGEYKDIAINHRIVMTWDTTGSCTPGKESSVAKDSVITINFTATSETTSSLELIHEFLPLPSIDDHHLGWTCALLDLDRHLNAPRRVIRDDLKVEVTRTMPFNVNKVWDAWTNPALVQKWFNRKGATLGRAEVELKVGRNFFMDYQTKTGDVLRVYGEYLEIVPFKKLVFTWADDNLNLEDDAALDKGYESRVTVALNDLGKSTEIKVIHDRLSSSDIMEDFEKGWTDCLRSMEEEIGSDSTQIPTTTKIYINAEPTRVFSSITSASTWDQWFTTGMTLEQQVGGKIQFRWKNWGPDNVTTQDGGEILVFERASVFAFNWFPAGPNHPVMVTFTLKPMGSGTELCVTEQGYPKSEPGLKAQLSCATGWGEALALLKFYLEHGIVYSQPARD
jgi:uncharacterized protein YndB with AHSA1/START domain